LIDEKEVVLATLKAHIDPSDLHRATLTFLRYYTRQATFAEHDSSWEWIEEPVIFWQLHYDDCPALSKLADRLLHTLANSVPCERNFSSMNVIHSNIRNRLTPERVDKLLYIQINRRTLNRDIIVKDGEDEEEEQATTEEEPEQRLSHTNETQERSEDVEMNSGDELQG
jgi:hAT family C-terminal dimerisation region